MMTDSIAKVPVRRQAAAGRRVECHGMGTAARPALAGSLGASDATSYAPPALFASQANARADLCERADVDRLQFWAEQARKLRWDRDFTQVLDWSGAPFARWFVGGKINVAVNCLDRHVEAGKGDRVALHWVGDPGDSRDVTYGQLRDEVCRAANYFTQIGLRAGDRVAIYMPMVPEAIVAMLACARLGLVHLTVFTGATATALRGQVDDAQAKVLITADGQYRRGAPEPLKCIVDEALAESEGPGGSVETVIVARRTGGDVKSSWVAGRDVWWEETISVAGEQHLAESFDAEHPLFLFYTSCIEGRPRGLVHSSGGYLTQALYTFHYVFDHKEGRDVFWCDAALGSIAGHTYQVYGPLSSGATSVIYEGAADFPDECRHFQVIERYGVTTYYVASERLRAFADRGRAIPDAHDLSSLRLLGTTGEPGNQEAWQWYHDVVGGGRCPVVVTWWRPETGAIMIAPMPGVTTVKPGSPMSSLPGISAHIVDDDTDLVSHGERGTLVLDRPWPSMARGIWRDDELFVDMYWRRFSDRYWCYTGVAAQYDDDDAIWLLGREDVRVVPA
jgi:acetyl-CoA synthetase